MPGAVMPRLPGVMPTGSMSSLRKAVSPVSRLRKPIWRDVTSVICTRSGLWRKVIGIVPPCLKERVPTRNRFSPGMMVVTTM